MHLLDDKLILSPSDLSDSLSCNHLIALKLDVSRGNLTAPKQDDASAALLSKRGDKHELAYLAQLKADGKSVIELKTESQTAEGLKQAEAETLAAMQAGPDVIFQGTFFDGRWRGHSDFLEKVETPSNLGSYSYEVVDTKLAHHAKVSALLQIVNYSEHIARLQGTVPENMHLQLGNGTRATFKMHDFDAYYRAMKRRFEDLVDNEAIQLADTYPDPVSHCAVCNWAAACAEKRETDDHLSLVAGMGRSQIDKLKRHGITTTAAFGATDDTTGTGISSHTLNKLKQQAQLQLKQRKSGEVSYELLAPSGNDNEGFGALPPPSPGDLFFDMEGDPYVGTHGIEYLFGATREENGQRTFTGFWGHTPAEEKKAFEDFVDFAMAARQVEPDLHIYHYAPYETSAMKKLAARYDTREAEIDELLRGEVFVDLYRVVRQSLRISQGSYSIKKLEPFYMPVRETEVAGGAASIVAYEEWLETKDQKILDDIEAYNKDDCDSTLLLRNWLEERRTEAITKFGEISRPTLRDNAPSAELTELEERIRQLSKALFDGDITAVTNEDDHARWLLSQLLEWHRRERKAEWWRYYELLSMSHDELYEDREALARLEYQGVVGTEKRSEIHEYHFDPTQDHKITEGSIPIEPFLEKAVGEVWYLDDEQGVIRLKRGKGSTIADVVALMPPGPIRYDAQQEALLDLGQWVGEHGIDKPGPFSSGVDLLLRRPPRLRSGRDLATLTTAGTDVGDLTQDLALDLDNTTLAIQGPPGSGKTYAGAEIVLSLVKAGLRVGITATGHKVIGNLLDEIAAHAEEAGQTVRILQKSEEADRCSAASVDCTKDNKVVKAKLDNNAVDVVGGTAWLFSRDELRNAFDVLIIDEAGQFSLADAMAVSTSAKSMILLGDPQQLAQPSKGAHPDGAEKSALAHLLGDNQTIPPELGVLLDRSWRMHPDVCDYISEAFYDKRLSSVDNCDRQVLSGNDEWSGAGLRYLPVEHAGNRTSAKEEVETIAQAFKRLIGRQWTDRKGNTKTVGVSDILVVAPYNAQVSLLKRTLPDGARVGTVDKFQGQEAAIVFYSMCASSEDDISRGIDFLYSTNRLNVAISRAKCQAYLVCSPALLTIAAKAPEEARLVNALCRAVETASA